MSHNLQLAERIRRSLAKISNVKEQKMFGGLAFMINDKMCITVGENRMMCRIDPALHQEATQKDGCTTVTMRNREYKGYVHVREEVLHSDKALNYWLQLALDFNEIAKSSKR